MDLSKAFDNLDNQILLKWLNYNATERTTLCDFQATSQEDSNL